MTSENAARLSSDEVARRLNVDPSYGLEWKEAEQRCRIYGNNDFILKEVEPIWQKYIEQFKNPLILLLLGSAVVSVCMQQFDDAISITVVSI